jgi:hypothetical protein
MRARLMQAAFFGMDTSNIRGAAPVEFALI